MFWSSKKEYDFYLRAVGKVYGEGVPFEVDFTRNVVVRDQGRGEESRTF